LGFQLFNDFERVAEFEQQPATRDLYAMLTKLRMAVRAKDPTWARYPNYVDYANICFWAIRKQEYSFIAESFVSLESGQPLKVLDVGCGVVPLCNWISARGHDVTALDPLAEDIEFLVKNNLNEFYGSAVKYLTTRAEHLPFSTGSFDVITCVSVLEHIVPGNDWLSLYEMARVLRPGGKLLITFDVSPVPTEEMGSGPKQQLRGYTLPFTYQAAQHLSQKLEQVFEISPQNLPVELDVLTWDQVHQFWRKAQTHDERRQPLRQYLAIGSVLTRRSTSAALSLGNREVAYLEGQAALLSRLTFFERQAGERENLLHNLDHDLQISNHMFRDKDAQIINVNRLKHTVKHLLPSPRHFEMKTAIGTLGKRIQSAEVGSTGKRWLKGLLRAVWHIVPYSVRHNIRQQFVFRPKLGTWQQYEPIPVKIPAYYMQAPTGTNLPTISIVTPSYNQGMFIEQTIKSILDQNYPCLEYVIQDGASTDNTRQILAQYQSQLTQVESIRDKGQSNALNLGFAHTTGEIMAYLNSDDLLLPGSLNCVGAYFARHPEVDVIYGHRVVINEYGQEIGRWVLPPHRNDILSWVDYVPQETMFWRRQIWETVGGQIDESFQFALDWDLLLRFRDAGATFAVVPRFLAAFRVHINQKTVAQMERVGLPEIERLRKRCLGYDVTKAEIFQHIDPYLRRQLWYDRLYRWGLLKY
jgi:glycosyltransferase involved in cell wall biosynthesis/ubiquinone/menaquinone biosynthesis C-methylase UbiE